MLKDRPVADTKDFDILKNSGVPVISLSDACASCDDPCDEDQEHSAFQGLDIDMDSTLLGSLKGNSGRTVIVATGKTDWPHSVTDEKDMYTHQIQKSYDEHLPSLPKETQTNGATSSSRKRCLQGITGFGDGYSEDGKERLRGITVLCGSQQPYEPDHSTHDRMESVLVFPDYKLVTHLPSDNAQELVEQYLSPRITDLSPPSPSSASIRSFLLPYYAVILVCSHKRRDKRCHITADPLIHALTSAIESQGSEWSVDTRGDDDHLLSEREITSSSTSEFLNSQLKALHSPSSDRSIGIFKVSHVGGHRYAGNVMIWLPNGVNIWYARVREVDAKIIVQETLVKGRVVTDLLRGGLGIAGRDGGSVLDW